MRILVLGPFAPSLVSFRGEMLRSFVDAGHEVFAAAPDPRDGDTTARKLDALGVRYVPFDFARANASVVGDLELIKRLFVLFRQLQPDLYFGYAIKPVVYGTIAARLARVPKVASMITGLGHAFLDDSPRGKVVGAIARTLYRAALSLSDTIFFHNEDDRDFFVDEKIVLFPERTAVTNGSGVDLMHYAQAPLPSGSMTFLLIGRLLREKGVVEYAEAARIVKRSHPQARITLLGPFDDNPSALSRREVDAWVAEGVLDYLGEAKDVRPFIAAAHVVVLPSYHEGTPRSVLEAMAMGRPVVTTDVPGCRQTTEDGVTGLLVPVRDGRVVAQAMLKFLDDPARVAPMGAAARARAERLYDVHEVNARILAHLGL